jgi:hypothetical protein
LRTFKGRRRSGHPCNSNFTLLWPCSRNQARPGLLQRDDICLERSGFGYKISTAEPCHHITCSHAVTLFDQQGF